MGVYVDALALDLFEQHLQIVQIVTCDHDERSLLERGGNRCRHRITIRACVGGIQQSHAGEIDFAAFEDQAQPLFNRMGVAQRLHTLDEPCRHFRIGLT